MKDKTPEAGEVWLHKNGIPYRVLFLANDGRRGSYPVSVVYEGSNGKRWVRELSDWHRSFSEKEKSDE